MNHYRSKHYRSQFLVMTVALLAPAAALAEVTGLWDTTALTRIVVTQPAFPGARPDSSAEIADGNYQFDANGSFIAGDITGSWRQKGSGYVIKVDRTALADSYKALIEADPQLKVNSVRVVSGKLSGIELTRRIDTVTAENSLWGNEAYVYRVDLENNGVRQVLRVAMTVRVAGLPPPAPALQGLISAVPDVARPTALQLAAAAVIRYCRNVDHTTPLQ